MKPSKHDFILVVIGQIVSLFGNAVLRFALPLHLLTITGSSTLFGTVLAISALPMLILMPVGGIVADRVNKRNVMVILDAITGIVIGGYWLCLGQIDIVTLTLTTLLILFGIQGAYTPSVSASLPFLVPKEDLNKANAIVSIVTNVSQLIGPVVGGMLYGQVGIYPILGISIICFIGAAIMEIFIHIPFEPQDDHRSVLAIAYSDLKAGLCFMIKDRPVVMQISLMATGLNVFLSALFIIGLPVIITKNLGFDAKLASQLYGYAEGSYAAGGLIGAIAAGTVLNKLPVRWADSLIVISATLVFPLGLTLQLNPSPMTIYIACLVITTAISISVTAFSVKMVAYLQSITPEHLIGKVMAFVITMGMAAMPIGQAAYGALFDLPAAQHYLVVYGGGICSLIIAIFGIWVFRTGDLPELTTPNQDPDQDPTPIPQSPQANN